MSKAAVLNYWLDLANEDAKNALDFQTCSYYPRLTETEISQQSADQLLRSRFNPIEFDGFRIDTEVHNPEMEQEDTP